jgi:hypothetical protein
MNISSYSQTGRKRLRLPVVFSGKQTAPKSAPMSRQFDRAVAMPGG